MKQTFKMSGNSDVKVKIQVQVEAPRYVLTRDEIFDRKSKLQNEIHEVLRTFGYDVKEISLS